MAENKDVPASVSTEIECSCSISNFRRIATNRPGYKKTVRINCPQLRKHSSFKMVVYPCGFNERTRDYISLFVVKDSMTELDVKLTCAIAHPDGRPFYSKWVREHLAMESVLGWTAFCHRNQVLNEELGVLSNGKLNVLCKFEFFEPEESHSQSEKECLFDLSENFRRSFPDLDFSDFVLRSPERTFEVHKSVLSARSPVLKAMMSLPSDELSVQNISSEGLRSLLEFVYTGTLRHLTLAIAYEVYTAADKYGILCLKRFCSEMLANKLSVGNVLALLLVSHDAKDSFLHMACLDFVVGNMDEIKEKQEWIDLMRNSPELANNVIFYKEHKFGEKRG